MDTENTDTKAETNIIRIHARKGMLKTIKKLYTARRSWEERLVPGSQKEARAQHLSLRLSPSKTMSKSISVA